MYLDSKPAGTEFIHMANDLTGNHKMGRYSRKYSGGLYLCLPSLPERGHLAQGSPGCVSVALPTLLRPVLAKGRQMAENRVVYLIHTCGLQLSTAHRDLT